jgi:hypothetical protein
VRLEQFIWIWNSLLHLYVYWWVCSRLNEVDTSNLWAWSAHVFKK